MLINGKSARCTSIIFTTFTHQDYAITLYSISAAPLRWKLRDEGDSLQALRKPGDDDDEVETSQHYILACPKIAHFYIRKPSSMSLKKWFKYLLDLPVRLDRISKFMIFFFQINNPIFLSPTLSPPPFLMCNFILFSHTMMLFTFTCYAYTGCP